jgi:hypothetical protein
MDQDAILKQMKALKSKAKAARKEGKRAIAATFRDGAARLSRRIRAAQSAVKKVVKEA